MKRAGLALLAGVGLVSACASLPAGLTEPAGDFVTVEGEKIHYVMEGSGRDVVLLHGASGNLLDWTFRAFGVLAQNHRVVAFDRPGLGLSPARDDAMDLAGQARVLRAAAAALGLKNPIIVGHSYGGALALRWGLDAPDDTAGLVLVGAVSHRWEGGLGALYAIANTPIAGAALAWAAPIVATDGIIDSSVKGTFVPQSPPDGYADHIRARLITRPESYRANGWQMGALKDDVTEMMPLYPGLTIPVEIIHGTADDSVPLKIHAEPLSRALPRVTYTPLDGMGHMPHQFHADIIAQAVARIAAQTRSAP